MKFKIIAICLIGLLLSQTVQALTYHEYKIRERQIKRLRHYIMYKYRKYKYNDEESFWDVFQTIISLDLAMLKDMKQIKDRTEINQNCGVEQ